jgi:hypothetical protein
MAKPTEKSVLAELNRKAGRKDYFEAREVETAEGKVTQIISGGGSLVMQVNAVGDEAWKQLEGETGAAVVDAGTNPTEAVEDNKQFTTKTGTVAFPTQPEAILPAGETVFVDNRKPEATADSEEGDPANANRPDSAPGKKTRTASEGGAKKNSDSDPSKAAKTQTGVGSTLSTSGNTSTSGR